MDRYRMMDGKDVTDFLSGLISFIKKVVNYIIISVRAYLVTAVVIFFLILGIGAWYWYSSIMLYESDMVCEFNDLSKKTYGEMVQKLDMLAKTKSYNALATYLHIPVNDAKEIVHIEGRNMVGSFLYEDITADKSPMYFKVIATDNAVFAPLQTALPDYLNSNSPVALQGRQAETETINARMEFLKKNITLTDSVILAYTILLKKTNPSDTLYTKSNVPELLNYKRGMENELLSQEQKVNELKTSVKILHGFMPADHPVNEKNKILLATIELALFLPVFIAILCRLLRDTANPKTT